MAEAIAVDAGLSVEGDQSKVTIRFGPTYAVLYMPADGSGAKHFDTLVNNMAAIVDAVLRNFETEAANGDPEVHG